MTYPIILAHGVCPFDFLWNKALALDTCSTTTLDNFHYFKGIRSMLQQKGFQVYHSRSAWAAKVENRSTDLKNNVLRILKESNASKVNIIAHSMGGLDTRHMLFNDRNHGGIHEKVASLTTISTPHHGSPYADWGVKHLPFVVPTAKKLGIDIQGLEDLQTVTCKAYNSRPDVLAFEKECEKATLFQTYAGRQNYRGVFTPLKKPFRVIEKAEGENDGLVSVQSAKWRDRFFRGTIDDCDHLNEVGWWDVEQLIDSGESPSALRHRIHRLYADIAKGLP